MQIIVDDLRKVDAMSYDFILAGLVCLALLLYLIYTLLHPEKF
jgi:K+-transporting ATPase KdpF subunit